MNKTILEAAEEMGRRHANPEIRSMYPSTSRGDMAKQFAQLFALGWDARAAEVSSLKAKLQAAEEWAERKVRDAEVLQTEVERWEERHLIEADTLRDLLTREREISRVMEEALAKALAKAQEIRNAKD